MTARIAPIVHDLALHLPPDQQERGTYACKQSEAFDAILRERDVQIDNLLEDLSRLRRRTVQLEQDLARARARLP